MTTMHALPDVGQRLDIRVLLPHASHERVFEAWRALAPGASFTLYSDDDARSLFYLLEAEHHGDVEWEYLQLGPGLWRIRVGRAART